jgi:hypothetical protein
VFVANLAVLSIQFLAAAFNLHFVFPPVDKPVTVVIEKFIGYLGDFP